MRRAEEIPGCEYVRVERNMFAIATVIEGLSNALDDKYGKPIVPDAPKRHWTWPKVMLRDLYKGIPLEVWQDGEEIFIPIPLEVIALAQEYLTGVLPPFVSVPNEGIAFLRRLTRGEEDGLEEHGQN